MNAYKDNESWHLMVVNLSPSKKFKSFICISHLSSKCRNDDGIFFPQSLREFNYVKMEFCV